MPTISHFFGITIRMYYRDHPPPHFHAIYQGAEAIYDIATGAVLVGGLPPGGRSPRQGMADRMPPGFVGELGSRTQA